MAVGHSGFAGWEREYLIPMGYGMVVVTAAFEEHPNAAEEGVASPFLEIFQARLDKAWARERRPCPWQQLGASK